MNFPPLVAFVSRIHVPETEKTSLASAGQPLLAALSPLLDVSCLTMLHQVCNTQQIFSPPPANNIIKLTMGLQTPQLPLLVQPATECLFIRGLLPLLDCLLDCWKQPPPQRWYVSFFSSASYCPSSYVLLFFILPLLLVGRDCSRCRCGRGRAKIADVLYGRAQHNRREYGRACGRGNRGLDHGPRRFWLYDKICTPLQAMHWLAVSFCAFDIFFTTGTMFNYA